MKLLVLGISLALITAFTAVDVSARPPCGKVWVRGHHGRHGGWIPAHWKHLHWIPGHHSRHGGWIPGHCR